MIRSFFPSWLRVLLGVALVLVVALAADIGSLRILEPVGDTGLWENNLAAELRGADASRRSAIEQELIAVAVDTKGTLYGRHLACRLLHRCATERAAAALTPLLADPAMSDQARLVIEGVESPVADLALIAGLGKSEGEIRRGIIASLAVRGTGLSFVPLAELAVRADEPTALAALRALGLVARDARDVNTIAALPLGTAEAVLVAQQEAFFTAIARLADRKINLDEVVVPFPKMQARTPAVADLAVGVMLRMNPAQAVPQIVAMFQTGEPAYQRRAAQALGLLPDAGARAALVAQAGELPAGVLPVLIEGLAARGAVEILPLARLVLASDNEPAGLAAIAAVGMLGDSSDVPALLRLAAGDGESAKAGIAALRRLPDRKADALLRAEFARADSPVRDRLPDIFAARAVRDAVPAMLAAAPAAPRKLSEECYRAIGELGAIADVPTLREQWAAAPPAQRAPVERAIVGIGRHSADGTVTRALSGSYAGSKPDTQASVIRMVAGIGDAAALEFFAGLVKGKKPNEAAVRALAGWRSEEAVPILAATIRAGRLSAPVRAEAWQGMVRIAQDILRRNRGDALPIMDESLALAQTDGERQQIMALVSDADGPNVLAWLTRWSSDAKAGALATKARDAMKQRIDGEP